jgi:hypothetical protein
VTVAPSDKLTAMRSFARWLGLSATLALLVLVAARGLGAAAPSPGAHPALTASLAAKDIDRRLARWKPVEMPWNESTLNPREQQMVERLVAACRELESIYWRQNDPQSLDLYLSLADAKTPALQHLRRLLWINGSRYDLLDENRPFVGTSPAPPGRALYPADLGKDELERYVAAHPAEKQELLDPRTRVVRANGGLAAEPYRVAYGRYLGPAARELEQAASLSADPAFAHYLRLRARALQTDDYLASDLAWVDLVNPKVDLIFAPYETYLDDLRGVKTSYGAAVMVRNEEESAKLALYQRYVPDLQDALPLPAEDRPSKHGHVAPMEVMDTPYRAGDLRHGYQAVADNLPNDPRVHEQRGSKQIFFKNFMDARVEVVILPIAHRLLRADQGAMASPTSYLAGVLMHEISHGLGPAFARRDGKQVDIREAIGPAYAGLEEAKADVTGLAGLAWLVGHGFVPKPQLAEDYASYVAGVFRTLRFGTGEAHGRAEIMEFNYLREAGAIGRDADGRYAIDFEKMPGAIAQLSKTLLVFEATGDRAGTEAWFAKYGHLPAELNAALATVADLPVDVDPTGTIADGVR